MSNTSNISSTLQAAHKIKQNLEDQIRCITNQPEIFAQSPLDFHEIENYLLRQRSKLFSLSVDKVFLVNYSLTLILHFKRQLLPHLYRLEVNKE
ncbi:hypothetical protein IGK31_003160 [Enterococcus sp. DIV1288f]